MRKDARRRAKQKFDEAGALFEKAVQIYPKYAAAWFELGRIQLQKNEPDAARHSFEQSIAADSKYVNPYRGLAELDTQQQHWESLVKVTDQLLALNPSQLSRRMAAQRAGPLLSARLRPGREERPPGNESGRAPSGAQAGISAGRDPDAEA